MKIIYKKQFEKMFIKLNKHQREAVEKSIIIFQKDPFDTRLKNHPLKGNMKNYRSISAGFDLRIIFEQIENYTYVHIIKVGTHNQVH